LNFSLFHLENNIREWLNINLAVHRQSLEMFDSEIFDDEQWKQFVKASHITLAILVVGSFGY
jgi:hypothetical protein